MFPRVLMAAVLTACAGCMLPYPRLLASDSAQGILVQGIEGMEPVSAPVDPLYPGQVLAHVYGDAVNLDTAPHTLTVELTRSTLQPDFDAVQYDTIAPGATKHFDLTFSYTVGEGYQFQEQVILGADSENLIRVSNITLDISQE